MMLVQQDKEEEAEEMEIGHGGEDGQSQIEMGGTDGTDGDMRCRRDGYGLYHTEENFINTKLHVR